MCNAVVNMLLSDEWFIWRWKTCAEFSFESQSIEDCETLASDVLLCSLNWKFLWKFWKVYSLLNQPVKDARTFIDLLSSQVHKHLQRPLLFLKITKDLLQQTWKLYWKGLHKIQIHWNLIIVRSLSVKLVVKIDV